MTIADALKTELALIVAGVAGVTGVTTGTSIVPVFYYDQGMKHARTKCSRISATRCSAGTRFSTVFSGRTRNRSRDRSRSRSPRSRSPRSPRVRRSGVDGGTFRIPHALFFTWGVCVCVCFRVPCASQKAPWLLLSRASCSRGGRAERCLRRKLGRISFITFPNCVVEHPAYETRGLVRLGGR